MERLASFHISLSIYIYQCDTSLGGLASFDISLSIYGFHQCDNST